MLPFFRKIRWRLANDNQFWKYSRYAIGEIVLVVIGILIALQVNNWNENRINYNIQEQYLQRIQIDINKDLENLISLKSRHQERINRAKRFIEYFGERHIEKDTLNKLFWSVHHSDDFIEVDDTYRDMINSSKLDLIKSDSIKVDVIDLYAHYDIINNYEKHIETDNRENIYRLSINLFDWDIIVSGTDPELIDEEFQKISSNLQMKNAFILFVSVADKLTYLYNEGIMKIKSLDASIKQELEK